MRHVIRTAAVVAALSAAVPACSAAQPTLPTGEIERAGNIVVRLTGTLPAASVGIARAADGDAATVGELLDRIGTALGFGESPVSVRRGADAGDGPPGRLPLSLVFYALGVFGAVAVLRLFV